MMKKKAVSLFLAACMAFVATKPVSFASELEVQQAESEVEENRKQVEEAKSLLQDLESKKSDINTYLAELNSAIDEKQKQINQLQEQMEAKQQEIDAAKEELLASEDLAQRQYETMKLRIQYMYETGVEDYIGMLFSSNSFTELLGGAEYISQISEYDRSMLKEYQNVLDTIAAHQVQLESDQSQLTALMEQAEADKGGLDVLVAAQNEKLSQVSDQIAQAKKSLADNEEELEVSEELLAYLQAELERQMLAALQEQQRRAEEASRAASIAASISVEESIKAASQSQAQEGNSGDTSSEADKATTGQSSQPQDGTLLLTWPVPSSHRITSYFGPRPNQPVEGVALFHNAIDIAAPEGSDIVAAADGTVTYVGDGKATGTSGGGYQVWLTHDDGTCLTTYMHCSALYVAQGQHVSAGTVIAAVGNTGLSAGNHLDFRVILRGVHIDPLGDQVSYR